MRRMWLCSAFVVTMTCFAAGRGYAQQAINVSFGGFVPQKHDSRADNDVLIGNLDFLDFDLADFNGPTLSGEWLFPLGRYFDGGVGVGIYSRSVPSMYADYEHENGADIEQELKLRVVPFTATIRFLPLPRDAGVQPYIGAGVGIFSWRYSEAGEFIDFSDATIFNDRFVSSGATAGPVIFGGVNVPLGSFGIGGEIRYQDAEGELDFDQDFAGSKVDLGGFNYLFTFRINF
jgi:hypothetical protein